MKKSHRITQISEVFFFLCATALTAASQLTCNNVSAAESDWNFNPTSMNSQTCQGFSDFAVNSKTLLTDGLVVIKDGAIQYEYYNPKYSAEKPHILWSVSKTVTGALLGVAVRDRKVSLDQKLSDFYPKPSLDSLSTNDAGSDLYDQIDISNLFYLDTGFIWDEYYEGNVTKSPVLSMLFGSDHSDMAKFAASRSIVSQGPGYEWNYSTGTPVITMKVLKQVYGDSYERMPWDSLFDPLGMKNVTFERDSKGVFVGGSSMFATPRDMARIGSLYLNRGVWRGHSILPEDWIEKTLSPSPGYLSSGTVIHDITDDGVYGGSIWLNRAVKPDFGRPYPYSPEDMFLAMGHFGQWIIVLPSQNMVIARTGHDQEYNSKIDEFVSRAISCFSDSNYPIGKIIPPPTTGNNLGAVLATVESGIRDDVIQGSIAKWICSCHFVSGLDTETCLDWSNIPAAKYLARLSIDETRVAVGRNEVDVKSSWLGRILSLHWGKTVTAVFDPTHPQFGCTLE